LTFFVLAKQRIRKVYSQIYADLRAGLCGIQRKAKSATDESTQILFMG